MSEETSVVQSEPVAQTPPAAADPFSLEENQLASLSPEQRASLDPILDGWKKKANDEISKRESSASEKYKPLEEKADALEKLTKYQPFVQWWNEQQKAAAQGANSQTRQNIQQSKPEDVASPQEWQQAIWDSSNGDSSKLQALQQRMFSTWASPIFQEQQAIRTEMAVRDLFDRHPDAKELDSVGLDPKTGQGVSLLEQGLKWAEENRRPLEEGYALAKRWADSFQVRAQQQAMGMVQEKKGAVTEGPSKQNASHNVIEVDSQDELIKRSMDAQISGSKDVRFVIRGK